MASAFSLSRRAALAALTLGSSAIVLTDSTVPALAPQLREDTNLSLGAIGWIFKTGYRLKT